MARFLSLTVATVLLAAGHAAHAADCADAPSHAAEGECEAAATQAVKAELDAAYQRLLAAAERSAATTAPLSFTTRIADDQARWSAWATTECRLTADLTMGTAAITEEPICLRRMYADRTRQLADLAGSLP